MIVWVIIPAYNEEQYVGDTVRAVAAVIPEPRVLVVDDGSADETVKRAKEAGAEVLVMDANGGKGQAMNLGVSTALTRGGPDDLVLLLDADLGSSAVSAKRLLSPLLRPKAQSGPETEEHPESKADLVIAAFARSSKGVGGGGFGLAVGLARTGLRLLTGLHLESPLSGQRGMTQQGANLLFPVAGGWGAEVNMTLKAHILGLSIVEVPCKFTHRVTGRSLHDIGHRAAQFWAVLAVLIRHVLSGILRPGTVLESGDGSS